VPNFVKCLGDVGESCGTLMFIVKSVNDFVLNAMCLMDGRMPLAEAKLISVVRQAAHSIHFIFDNKPDLCTLYCIEQAVYTTMFI
jgi:hypothetical protein